jgi:hypothetical protein
MLDRADPLNVGLQAWWPLGGNGNETTSRYPAVANGNTTSPSMFGPTYYFDGSSKYLTVSTFPVLSTPLTVSVWVYPTSLSQSSNGGGSGGTILTSNTTGNTSGWSFGLEYTYKMWFWPAGGADQRSTSLVSLNTWNHVAVTVGSGSVSFYLNGVFSNTTTMTAPQVPTFLEIVTVSWITGYMEGQMAHLRLHNRALTWAEIQRLYFLEG